MGAVAHWSTVASITSVGDTHSNTKRRWGVCSANWPLSVGAVTHWSTIASTTSVSNTHSRAKRRWGACSASVSGTAAAVGRWRVHFAWGGWPWVRSASGQGQWPSSAPGNTMGCSMFKHHDLVSGNFSGTCEFFPLACTWPCSLLAAAPACQGSMLSQGGCKHAKLFQRPSGFLRLMQTCQTVPRAIRVLVVVANMPSAKALSGFLWLMQTCHCSKGHQGSCSWCKHAKLFQEPSGFLWLM